MKRMLCGIVATACGAALLAAQEGVRVITYPSMPSREVLERLSLDVAWRAKIKFQNGRDGLYSVQLIPSKEGPEVVVQTLAGAVYDGVLAKLDLFIFS